MKKCDCCKSLISDDDKICPTCSSPIETLYCPKCKSTDIDFTIKSPGKFQLFLARTIYSYYRAEIYEEEHQKFYYVCKNCGKHFKRK